MKFLLIFRKAGSGCDFLKLLHCSKNNLHLYQIVNLGEKVREIVYTTFSPTRVFKKKCAFTLAEVLVTLGIIGVVSAMTVPTLMQNHQRKTYVTQLHKVYSEFSQAFVRYQTDHNAINLVEAGLSSSDKTTDFMTQYFKIVNDCGTKYRPCFADEYRSIDGTKTFSTNVETSDGVKCFVIASGASICVSPIAVYETSENFYGGLITIDVNGVNGPNIGGRDMFIARFYQDGSIDEYKEINTCSDNSSNCISENREKRFESFCQKSPLGDGCFGKILNDNWEMNY